MVAAALVRQLFGPPGSWAADADEYCDRDGCESPPPVRDQAPGLGHRRRQADVPTAGAEDPAERPVGGTVVLHDQQQAGRAVIHAEVAPRVSG